MIRYFANRPLLGNVVLVTIIATAILLWRHIGKEEYPDFAMDWVRFSILYPGATAEDVELFVIKPIEEKLKEITGLYEINAVASAGVASFRVTIETGVLDKNEVIRNVKDAVDRAEIPPDTEDPVYRRFSSAEKAIIDIGIYYKGKRVLDVESRTVLQKYALTFENRIITLPEVSSLDQQGYLEPELQILVKPDLLRKKDISMGEVREQVIAQNVRVPAGSLEDRTESEVSFLSELDTVQDLEQVIVQGGFEGQKIYLKEIAQVRNGFIKRKSVIKIQGHEGILYNVKKNASVDILTAQKAVLKFVDQFKANNPEAPIEFVLIDDESFYLRNRLSIIGLNGLIGFLLILAILFIFLDFNSGIWVASGLPFTLAFTLIASFLMGYSVNNITLAGVIIVLGIVVDDAIVVAENISRKRKLGLPMMDAIVEGTSQILNPVIASVLTTCAAFIPFYFFTGRYGLFVKFIPTIVILMLFASLFEAAFILPSHLRHTFKIPDWWTSKFRKNPDNHHWTHLFEKRYYRFLLKILPHRLIVFLSFIIVFSISLVIYSKNMKFVMFPREEAKEFTILAKAPEETTRMEMARLTEPLESLLVDDPRGFVTSVLTFIGQSRRGGEVKENEATLRAEIKPASERNISLNKLIEGWKKEVKALDGFTDIQFTKNRWGSESGSPIEFEIQENDDLARNQIAKEIAEKLRKNPAISNVEIEKPVVRDEYRLTLNREEIFNLGIVPSSVGESIRAFIEGDILYTINKGEEEVDVRLTTVPTAKNQIEDILNLQASNKQNYLIPFRNLVSVEKIKKPANIQRINYKRTSKIYADLKGKTKSTPLDIATYLENQIFPEISRDYPNVIFQFRGEIEDSRESREDFILATILALILIYILLVLLYNSLSVPLLIGTIIPFGVIGVILAFYSHGMNQYGFFAVVGTLGMIGVVINDSIIMISRLEETIVKTLPKKELLEKIADVCSTRLRAVCVTTLTTVAGIFPTAYGWMGYDSMLSEMMLAMGWGLLFGTVITLILVPNLYSVYIELTRFKRKTV